MNHTTMKTIIGLATLLTMPSAMTACDTESADELEMRLAGPGPGDDIELEFEDGVYEIEALDAQGKEVKLKVDPVSGKVNVK